VLIDKMTNNKLSKYETLFINLFGNLYEKRGQIRLLGEIWALLSLKIDGLNQQEIAQFLNKSVSNISRQLKFLVDVKLIGFKEEFNELRRKERKYFVTTNFRQTIIGSINVAILNDQSIYNELLKLKNSISDEEKEKNDVILKYMSLMEARLNIMNQIWTNIQKECLKVFKN
jgi:DNA-binding transcriptional regulator GbsR (MarR family)